MKPRIIKDSKLVEFDTPELCSIKENYNSSDDKELSIARARVPCGVKTKLHYLEGVDEKYLITSGKGIMEVGDLPPTEVVEGDMVIIPKGVSQCITNIGDADLIFYCICTPQFTDKCYCFL